MSIEKLDFKKVTKEHIPYTLISTKVTQNIKDPVSLAVWVFLCTLPPDWIVYKTKVREHFSISEKKLKEVFSYLNRSNLIQYIQERTEDNRFTSLSIHVLNGDIFDENVFYKENNISAGPKSTPPEKAAGPKSGPPEKSTCGKVSTTKEILKTNSFNKTKEIGKKRIFKKPDKQMQREKEEIKKHDKIKISPMPTGLKEMISGIKKSLILTTM